MDRVTSAFFSLLRSGLWQRDVDGLVSFPLTEEEWQKVMVLSSRQSVEALVWRGLHYLPEEFLPAAKLLMEWTAHAAAIEKKNCLMDKAVSQINSIFASAGLHPVLQKGQGLARLYNEPHLRECGDIDWFFNDRKDSEAALEIMSRRGIHINGRADGSSLYIWNGITVEHHRQLLDIYDPRRRRFIQDLIARYGFVAARLEDTEGPGLTVPSPGLEILLVGSHIFKHLAGRGIGLRQFCDMACCVKAHAGKISSEEFIRDADGIGMGRWFPVVNAFMVEYLGLDERWLPYSKTDPSRNGRILSAVMDGGNFGRFRHGRENDRKSSVRRKMHTLSAFIQNAGLSFPLAAGETFWILAGLLGGQSAR